MNNIGTIEVREDGSVHIVLSNGQAVVMEYLESIALATTICEMHAATLQKMANILGLVPEEKD